ncbi:methionyl-tRNA formyltransferase [Thermoanaerobacterium sp. DL9XJH110]|uniref:methionyl-tRNA formyltransferase n=1 Tax=Thermoanaerobacterium sp. DL9XJH110 TaxID=3386643 RepID=UPI003BB5F1EE
MKLVFMGTPEFAVPSLDALLKEGHEVAAVVTQPDRPVGRKRVVTPPPVKLAAMKNDLRVLQPQKVKDGDFIRVLSEIKPDLIVVVAFGQILPRTVLDIPLLGCINVHASLLPRYRGAAPVQWAIINGERVTGVTTMWMDEGLDTGDMFLQQTVEIKDEWTASDLSRELSLVGAGLLIETLRRLESGQQLRIPQDHNRATYAPMLKKEDGKIDWSKKAFEIRNLIRGLHPWPGAYTFSRGQEIKIWVAETYPSGKKQAPGRFMGVVKGRGFLVGTGEGCLLVKELQEAGKKKMGALEYLAGHSLREGDFFADV